MVMVEDVLNSIGFESINDCAMAMNLTEWQNEPVNLVILSEKIIGRWQIGSGQMGLFIVFASRLIEKNGSVLPNA